MKLLHVSPETCIFFLHSLNKPETYPSARVKQAQHFRLLAENLKGALNYGKTLPLYL
ncbi:MAG: hypothetical protein HFF84_00780 [Oscillibacter sp.]|nr:hypothetical protein [Oscillibacter sp.]